jgi:hypothetical protein
MTGCILLVISTEALFKRYQWQLGPVVAHLAPLSLRVTEAPLKPANNLRMAAADLEILDHHF